MRQGQTVSLWSGAMTDRPRKRVFVNRRLREPAVLEILNSVMKSTEEGLNIDQVETEGASPVVPDATGKKNVGPGT